MEWWAKSQPQRDITAIKQAIISKIYKMVKTTGFKTERVQANQRSANLDGFESNGITRSLNESRCATAENQRKRIAIPLALIVEVGIRRKVFCSTRSSGVITASAPRRRADSRSSP